MSGGRPCHCWASNHWLCCARAAGVSRATSVMGARWMKKASRMGNLELSSNCCHWGCSVGGGLPPHRHDHYDVFTMTAGGGEMHLGGEATPILAGDAVVVPPDGPVVAVEFKTGRPEPSHEAQVEMYRRALVAAWPDRGGEARIFYFQAGNQGP